MELPTEDEDNNSAQCGFDPYAQIMTEKAHREFDIEHRQRYDGKRKSQGQKCPHPGRYKFLARLFLVVASEFRCEHLIAVLNNCII